MSESCSVCSVCSVCSLLITSNTGHFTFWNKSSGGPGSAVSVTRDMRSLPAVSLSLILLCHAACSLAHLEEEEDEGWPRPAVAKALLIHIHNIERNCSLALSDQKYPVKYPDGRGSSHQFVVGCVPTTEADLNNNKYLWQLQSVSSEVSRPRQPSDNECSPTG